jgi:hypothetical protein
MLFNLGVLIGLRTCLKVHNEDVVSGCYLPSVAKIPAVQKALEEAKQAHNGDDFDASSIYMKF